MQCAVTLDVRKIDFFANEWVDLAKAVTNGKVMEEEQLALKENSLPIYDTFMAELAALVISLKQIKINDMTGKRHHAGRALYQFHYETLEDTGGGTPGLRSRAES